MLFDKDVMGAVSCVLSVAGYVPYFVGIFRGRVKPHIFSWVIWTLLCGIVFVAQVVDGAGPGAWAQGLSTVLSVGVVLLTLKHGDKTITRSDWVSFGLGLAAIPLWRFTDDPVWAVYTVSFVYVMAYWPTFRKSYHKPMEEALFMYVLTTFKNVFVFMAIEHYSMTTAFYVAAVTVMNIVFIAMVVKKRAVLAFEA